MTETRPIYAPELPASTRPPEPPRRPTLRASLSAKWPELLLEAASVVFAVMLALFVDQWRDNRENEQLAERARNAILAEIEANRAELLESRAGQQALLDSLTAGIQNAGDRPEPGFGVDFSMSLLSSAAWEAATVTRAVHFLDYAWVRDIAGLYEFQELFEASQATMFDRITGFSQAYGTNPRAALSDLRDRVGMLLGLLDKLASAYGDALDAPR
jgi:hypothetical protein